jgi:hypothetical protein
MGSLPLQFKDWHLLERPARGPHLVDIIDVDRLLTILFDIYDRKPGC